MNINKNAFVQTLINFGLTLYVFPPIGALFVALYEVYLVFYDVIYGFKCFLFGTGLVETQTNDVRAMKQYRRAVEIFGESVPQTLLQLWMFIRKVPVSQKDLFISLGISTFNLLINAYRFRKEAKMHGMSVSEYALSVLQLAEIPIVRLVPRLPAVKKGNLEFINFAGFTFDKESITPIVEALGEVRCMLNTMKISIGSLLNLDLESCRLMGRILKDARIRVFVSRAFSLLHIKNLFEEMDEDNNGYLDEEEFSKALISLNSGLLHTDKKQQKRIFQKLAVRRTKRDRVYFYDFFKNCASVEINSYDFDITQMDFPLHYVFQHLMTQCIQNTQNIANIRSMKKLYYFCYGLDCLDQIDRSVNNHIFFTIIDALNILENSNFPVTQFIIKCFHQILNSDVIINKSEQLLIMRNTLFERDIDENKYKPFVNNMCHADQYDGLNIFEYCFAFENNQNRCDLFVHLLNAYLKIVNKYSVQRNQDDAPSLFMQNDQPLYELYAASKFKWLQRSQLPITYAAEKGLFQVIEYFAQHLIQDYTANELHKVCVKLLQNQEQQNPDAFALLLTKARDHGMDFVNVSNNKLNKKQDETFAVIIFDTQRSILRTKSKKQINKTQLNKVNNRLFRYLEILYEFNFDFAGHNTLHYATKTKNYEAMKVIIQLHAKDAKDKISKLLKTRNEKDETPMLTAFEQNNLSAIKILLDCPEQDCDELFDEISDSIKYDIDQYLWIQFLYDIVKSMGDSLLNRVFYQIKQEIHEALKELMMDPTFDGFGLENKSAALHSVTKKGFNFGGIFKPNQIMMKQNEEQTERKTEKHVHERVGFKEMAVTLSNIFKANLDQSQPPTVKRIKETQIKPHDIDIEIDTTGLSDIEHLEICQQQCDRLKGRIQRARKKGINMLKKFGKAVNVPRYQPKQRVLCTGHMGKIYTLHWSADSKHIVTGSQDGKLIIWDPYSGNKQLAITLNSAWVMSCAFSPSCVYISSGGLDNTVSIFKVSDMGTRFRSKELYRELEKHDGYMSCARFIDDTELLSASGDGTCILWDIESRCAKNIFMDHTGDVMAIDVNTKNPNLFVSGSVDATAKVWDIRASDRCVANFVGHTSDINTVKWHISDITIITGSDDGTVRLFDLRAYRQLHEYADPENKSYQSDETAGVVSVDVSSTGSYIFSSYDNGQVYMWSCLTAEKICDMPHESRVSCIGVSPDGYTLATGSWDFKLRMFS